MKNVLCIIPRESMEKEDFERYVAAYPRIDFKLLNIDDISDEEAENIASKYEIVAGRGRCAHFFKQIFPNIHAVEIPITGYDIIYALSLTKQHCTKAAVITNYANIAGLHFLATLFGVEIISSLNVPTEELRNVILSSVKQGAQIIIGGSFTCQIAKKMGCEVQVIKLGEQSMLAMLSELQHIQDALNLEEIKQGFISKLMDSMPEGVIAVNEIDVIVSMNTIAEKILKINREKAKGKRLASFFECHPDSDAHMATINGKSIMVNRTPIKTEKSTGCIITLLHPDRIQKMEHIVRNETMVKTHTAKYTFDDLTGASDEIKETIRIGKSYAKTDSNIMLIGETGTGKELFSQSIHQASNRSNGAFVAINCAALPTNLLESELFGYVEGAFTGASKKGKVGMFELAHNGTLFLDEISEMDYQNQGRLLRVLQEKYIIRLGSNKITPVNVRIIAATNKDLDKMVVEKYFREDLYYRLNVLKVYIPPIRQRGNDGYLCVKQFLEELSPNSKTPYEFTPDALEFLVHYRWPGNIRQLHNICERIVATSTSSLIDKEYLLNTVFPQHHDYPQEPIATALTFKENKQKLEIINALEKYQGNISETAKALAIDRSTLWRRMKKYNIS